MTDCPDCSGSKIVLAGNRYFKGEKIQRYLCKICGHRFSEKSDISRIQQTGSRQICVTLDEGTNNLTGTENNQVLRENHQYTAIIEQFCWYMKRKEYSELTQQTRAFHLNKLVELKADLDTPESVETVLALSEWSKSYKKCFINTYQAYCKWRKIFWDAPRIHVPTKIEKLPTEENVKILIAGLSKRKGTLLQTCFETGARIGEVCKLTWEDIDFKNNKININAPEKRGNSRSINVTPGLISRLQNLRKRDDGYIFNPKPESQCSAFSVSRKRIAKKLGKPELNKIHFHTMRHLRATIELYKKGKHHRDVQQLLGHRSSQSTDRYCHYRPQAPTEWEVKRPQTKEEENQLVAENWTFIRYDEVHKEPIYRRAKC